MIDLHCHALPGVDDGPATPADAVALARAQVEAGVTTVLATPHVDHDHRHNDAASIRAGVERLRVRLRDEGVALEVLPGGEVALTRALDLPDDELGGLRLGGGPWLLVEPPFTPASATTVAEALFRLQMRGHRVLLAHPERSPVFQKNPNLLAECVGRGMLASVTAGALVGRFGRTVERLAVELVRDGLVHDVASDAHEAGGRRPPGIAGELEQAGLGDQVPRLCRDTPRAILEGGMIPPAPVLPEPRGGVLGRLFRRA